MHLTILQLLANFEMGIDPGIEEGIGAECHVHVEEEVETESDPGLRLSPILHFDLYHSNGAFF